MAEKSITSALGLENLKDFQETLKQYSETQQVLKEFNEQFGKLKSENSPIAQAIQRRFDAGTLKDLTEGDKTALEELKAKVEEDNQKLKESLTAMTEENKQLKETLQTKTTREVIAEELDKRFPKGGSPSGDDSLTKAINNLVAERLNALIGGDKGSTLTNEDVRRVVGEEVVKVTQGSKSADQVTDEIVKTLTMGDTIRQKLGLGGSASQLIGQGSNLRADLAKVVLEHDLAILRANQEYDVQKEKAKHLGTLAGAVKENMGDAVSAFGEMIKLEREKKSETKESKEGSESAGLAIKCSLCNEVSVFSEKPSGIFECPKCHGKLNLEQPGGGEKKPLPEYKPSGAPASFLEI